MGMGTGHRHILDIRDDVVDRHTALLLGLAPRELLGQLLLGGIAIALAGAAGLRPAGLGAPLGEAEDDHLRKLGVLVGARGERLGGEHPVRRARAAVRVVRVHLLVLRRRRRLVRGRRRDARLAALVRPAPVALVVAVCVRMCVAPGMVVVVGVAPDDDDRRGACMAVRCRGCYRWSVHPATHAHRLTPVVRREVGARACDGVRCQGSAEVQLLIIVGR